MHKTSVRKVPILPAPKIKIFIVTIEFDCKSNQICQLINSRFLVILFYYPCLPYNALCSALESLNSPKSFCYFIQCVSYSEHRTQNTEHRTQNTEHRTLSFFSFLYSISLVNLEEGNDCQSRDSANHNPDKEMIVSQQFL